MRTLWICLLVAMLSACPDESSPGPDTGTIDVSSDIGDTQSDTPVDTPDTADTADTADTTDALDSNDTNIADVADAPDSNDSTDSNDTPDIVLPPGTFSLKCNTSADCKTDCAVGSCVGGACEFAAPQQGCVLVDSVTGLGSCLTKGAVAPDSNCLFCNPDAQVVGYTPYLFAGDFETNATGFTISNLSGSPATWTLTSDRAGNGEKSLYFGDPNNKTYAVGEQRAWSRALTSALLVPADVDPQLSFLLWLDTEQLDAHDFLRVIVIYGNNEEHEVWHSDSIGGSTNGEFVPVTASLVDFAGQQIQLAFEFDSVDGIINHYEGAYLDGVRLTTGCCSTATDCDDANACTIDQCPESGGLCAYEADAMCCNSDTECDDGDSCTTDVCSGLGGQCQHFKDPSCCHSTGECNDGDPCTEDSCDLATETCSHQALCCEKDTDCQDADKCTAGTCVEGQCAYEFVCCLADVECDDGNYCTIDQCADGDCAHTVANLPGCCQPDIALLDFSEAEQVAGWDFDAAVGGVGWSVTSQLQVASGNAVLYYGDPSAGNFDNGQENQGEVVTTPFELPDGYAIELSFRYQFDGESSSSYDKFTLFVLTDAGEIELVDKGDISSGGWKTITRDLSYLSGQTVRFRFEFATEDAITNADLGMVVDDFKLFSTCEPKACTTASQCPAPDACTTGFCNDGQCSYEFTCCTDDSECDDSQVCTNDSCQNGKCQFQAISKCCEDVSDCDDNNACTTDVCPSFGGLCENIAVPDCCLSNAQCNDSDMCTSDTCTDNVCNYDNLCCTSDTQCNDGDDVCTIDSCVDQFCVYAATGVEGCCVPNPVEWSFEAPLVFTFTGTNANCKWQIGAGATSVSGLQTLFYADAAAGDYNCGESAGTALSESFTTSPDYPASVTWKLYMGTESSSSFDVLEVFVVPATGAPVKIWGKSDLGGQTNTWTTQTENLTTWAGQTIQLRFDFDTEDGVANSGDGVFIDDVQVTSDCP